MFLMRLVRLLAWLAPPPRGRHAARPAGAPATPPAPAPARPTPPAPTAPRASGPPDTAPAPVLVAADGPRRIVGPWYMAWERGRADGLDTVRADLAPLVRELVAVQAGDAR